MLYIIMCYDTSKVGLYLLSYELTNDNKVFYGTTTAPAFSLDDANLAGIMNEVTANQKYLDEKGETIEELIGNKPISNITEADREKIRAHTWYAVHKHVKFLQATYFNSINMILNKDDVYIANMDNAKFKRYKIILEVIQ